MNLQRSQLIEEDDRAIHDALGRLVRRLAPLVLRDAAQRLRKPLVGLTAEAERLLASVAWDGYARELRNVIERACILAEGELITDKELHGALPVGSPAPLAASGPGGFQSPTASAIDDRDGDLLTTVEREHIQRALQRAGGNKKLAAQILGVSRRALYRRLERLQLGDTITRRPRFEQVREGSTGFDQSPSSNPLEPDRT
jgi:DNA-binding NtrC family response regulator